MAVDNFGDNLSESVWFGCQRGLVWGGELAWSGYFLFVFQVVVWDFLVWAGVEG